MVVENKAHVIVDMPKRFLFSLHENLCYTLISKTDEEIINTLLYHLKIKSKTLPVSVDMAHMLGVRAVEEVVLVLAAAVVVVVALA